MGEKIVVGPINKGLRTDREPFVIDNDSFPVIQNAYQWRGRIKRKRGTNLLNRLQRYFNSSSVSYSATSTITFDGGGNANLLTGFGLQVNGNIVPGTVTITGSVGPVVYTDPTKDGFLTPTGTGGPNTINYATGAILIPAQAGGTATAIFNYFPDLPVMDLEDLVLSANQFPGTLAFDTTYSYNISGNAPYSVYDVSFFKNPAASASLPGYVPKVNPTPLTWNGDDYQQFWSTNYENAMWVTNGIAVPFVTTNIGMPFKPIVTVTIIAGGPPATATLQITGHGLVVGDFVFVNEVVTTTGINFQTGYVITVTDANNVIVEFPNATLVGNGTGGIAQYLTNRSDPTKDCMRWYDGDPTNGSSTAPVLNQPNGWVNFCPPLSNGTYSIADLPASEYYLVTARIVIPFKDRLLFIGPVVQSSSTGPFYLQDTIVYSQNGTPYYTASFTGSVTSSATVYNPILLPINQTSTANAFFEDVAGYGGFITAGFAQPILTAAPNQDVLILGFTNRQVKLVYTGNDLVPFNFFIINSELGSGSTFSAVVFDRGVLSIGDHGIIISNQVQAARIDLEIPDQVFQFNITNNGPQRVTAQRDYINEWVYFTYTSNEFSSIFPNQTLLYNYRDESWGVFNESYTTYGQFRKITGYTWATIGDVYPTWADWNDPWDAGESTLLQPEIIAGNQQGFVMIKDEGTGEGVSLYIKSFSGSQITSPDHGLNNGDYIVISGCLGTIGSQVNGKIFSVTNVAQNTFFLDPTIGAGTYFGGGYITRMYIPFIQTKQFPVSWGMSRKTRIGPQQYLFTNSDTGQIELQIYLSQNSSSPYNFGPVVPLPNSLNNALVYTDILYTCPESTNLGLTPANINLQQVTGAQQNQIWHRMNTSLIGDTIQIGFTMSDTQMRDLNFSNQFAEIELHSLILDVTPSQMLA